MNQKQLPTSSAALLFSHSQKIRFSARPSLHSQFSYRVQVHLWNQVDPNLEIATTDDRRPATNHSFVHVPGVLHPTLCVLVPVTGVALVVANRLLVVACPL